MAQFSRRTILATTDLLGGSGNAGITRFLLEHGLEGAGGGYSIRDRTNGIAKHLIDNPEATNDNGENITDAIVASIVGDAIARCRTAELLDEDEHTVGYRFEIDEFRLQYSALERALARDGFAVDRGGVLRKTLPEALDLPKADDEVHVLLDQYGFRVSKTHLDQGIAAHSRGEWEATNGQFRPFIEGLFDEIAAHFAQGAPLPETDDKRRRWLANRNPPFFYAALNEWNSQGTGFMQAFFRRLHPAGPHPGISDEEDCTFRLHLVLLVARVVLRRIALC
jgi:hypothetical protein